MFAVSQGMKDGWVGDRDCMVVWNRKGFIAIALETGASIVPWLIYLHKYQTLLCTTKFTI